MSNATRTRDALRAYDAAVKALFATATQVDADAALAALAASEHAVHVAFADDTAGINRRDVAMRAPIDWVRSLVGVL